MFDGSAHPVAHVTGPRLGSHDDSQAEFQDGCSCGSSASFVVLHAVSSALYSLNEYVTEDSG